MDPNSGQIFQVEDEQDAVERGLVPIKQRDLARVKAMSLEERRIWARTEQNRIERQRKRAKAAKVARRHQRRR